MNKDTKSFLLEYFVVCFCLIFLLYISNTVIENKDLIAFLGVLICLSTLILGFLVSINILLRKIAQSQTKTEEDWKLFINNQLNHDS